MGVAAEVDISTLLDSRENTVICKLANTWTSCNLLVVSFILQSWYSRLHDNAPIIRRR